MPRKLSKYICEICNKEFKIRSYPPPRSCSNKKCRYIIKSQNAKGRDYSDKWLDKICPTCKKGFKTRISREKTYCSNYCSLKSEERRNHLSKLYKGKTLKERGWNDEIIERDKQIKIERNKSMVGKTYKELYPDKEKREEYLNVLKEASSGDNNPMSYEKVMKREDIDSIEKAREIMPATGRNGDLHPMFGKHHTVESKIKMMETFSDGSCRKYIFANGYFDGIFWQGSWELKYIIDCKEKNISIKRYDLRPIEYIYENNIHHYFPDFIINKDDIIEIKGTSYRNKTIEKKEAAIKKYNNKYFFIEDVGQNIKADIYYKLMKEKFETRLVITHNPHEVKVD